MLVINCLLAVFILLSIAAPVFLELGWVDAGRTLYNFYRNFCHQFAFRSWFLFGEQAYYPKYSLNGLLTYEEMFALSPDDLLAARALAGNETAGYKIAMCQRDFAMYATLLVFGVIFSFSRNRIKRIPLWIWLLLGVLPLALDGITQLISAGFDGLVWMGMRESTPLLRTITGGLFGLCSAWYIYPSIENSEWVTKCKALMQSD